MNSAPTTPDNQRRPAACGSWQSPISAADLTRATRALAEPRLYAGQLYWLESRPDEGGRMTIMQRSPAGDPVELVPAPYNVRSRVHEYGGGAYCVGPGYLLFCNFADGALLRLQDGQIGVLVQRDGWRFADMDIRPDGDSLVAVAEIHSAAADGAAAEPENRLVSINLHDGSITTVAAGHDFFAAPRHSPQGDRLAYLSWDHPDMPWDTTTLHLAQYAPSADGQPPTLENHEHLAGDAALAHPTWSPSGRTLFYVSDASGYWNVVAWRDGEHRPFPAEAAEYAVPHWVFGQCPLTALDDNTLLAQRISNARAELVELHMRRGAVPQALDWQGFGGLQVDAQQIVFVGASSTRLAELVCLPHGARTPVVVRSAGNLDLPAGAISSAQSVTCRSADGNLAHAFFYAPASTDFAVPEGERPPLVVMTHGGPTSMAAAVFNPRIQFYTSRGWAVLDVNYGGSTGFGTAYRQRLDGQWGVVDVADCVAAVRQVTAAGLADPARVAIRGGSAGGYTTLAALAFTDTFAAGASHYGIGDLAALARDTHKFESRYTDRLVGPWPAAEALYAERSALFACERMSCPVIFFQGSEDRVVPPDQSVQMAAALRSRGLPVALVMFPGEGHGFRQPDNARQAIEQEYAFLARAFAIRSADDYTLPPIDNAGALPPLP